MKGAGPEPEFGFLADEVEDPTPPWQLASDASAEESYQGPDYSEEKNLRAHRIEVERSAAVRNMIFGLVLLAGGALFTLYSMDAAAARGEGSFLVATGAIGSGLLFLFRAFFRLDRR